MKNIWGKEKEINLSNIKTINDLSEYLNVRFEKEENFESYIISDNNIKGILDGFYFSIDFYYDFATRNKLMELKVEGDSISSLEQLENALAPIMWGGQVKDNYFASKILDYQFSSENPFFPCYAVVWDTINPEKTIEAFLNVLCSRDGTSIFNENIYYPYADLQKIREKSYFQNYPGKLRGTTINKIKNLSEFELFYEIRCLKKKFEAMEKNPNKKQDITSSVKINYLYVLSFLFAQTSKFGVTATTASENYREPSIEQKAWYEMWNNFFEGKFKENPNLIKDWKKNFAEGYDPNFAPEVDFKQYVKQFEERYLKEQADMQERDEKLAIERLESTQNKIKKMKALELERSKTLEGRATNLFEEVLRDNDSSSKGEESSYLIDFENF